MIIGREMNKIDPNRKTRRSQEERSSETRKLLIKTAVECICEFGCSGATTDVIAKRAKVSRGAINHHFKSRNEFMGTVIVRLTEELMREGSIYEDMSLSVPEKINRLVNHHWKVFSGPTFMAILHLWLGSQHDEEFSEHLFQVMSGIQSARLKLWLKVFADSGASKTQIEVARNLGLAALRGLAIQNMFNRKNLRYKSELEELKATLESILRP